MFPRRAETVVSELLDKEKVKHVKKALTANRYKKWEFRDPQEEGNGRGSLQRYYNY